MEDVLPPCLLSRLLLLELAAPCLLRGLAIPDWLVFFDFHLTLLMAKKDMNVVSRLKDTNLPRRLLITLLMSIPLDLRPRLPDPNFRMINLPAGDTTIGAYLPASSSRSEQVMSIHDFLCMPSLDKATVHEEPHELGTSILGRVADRTTSPVPAGTDIPCASPEEIVVTRPDRNVVTKADHKAKQKASTGPEISTNVTKRTRSSKKGSRAGFSEQAARDEVEQTDDGTLDDDDQRDGPEFAMEGNESLHDDGEHIRELARGVHDDGAENIASDGNVVDSYFDARVSNTARDVLERDLLPFVPGPYYIPYPFNEGSGSESPTYTRDDWEEIHGVNLGLRQKELYNDPKIIKKQSADEEVSRLKAELGALKSKCEATEQNLNSWNKKHRKYRNERDALALKKEKIEEELVGTKSQLEHCERQAEDWLIKSTHVAAVVPKSLLCSSLLLDKDFLKFLEDVLMKNKDAASSKDIQLICAEFSIIQVKTQAD
ncbi:hypothetical protein Tco_0544065 [Tanacetum coccineum]